MLSGFKWGPRRNLVEKQIGVVLAGDPVKVLARFGNGRSTMSRNALQ